MTDVTQAKYDELQQIANHFSQQGDCARRVMHDLQHQLDVLQKGAWDTDAAHDYFHEMNNDVMPSVNKLVIALNRSSDVTQEIIRIFRAAEEEASGYWNGADSSSFVGELNKGAVSRVGQLLNDEDFYSAIGRVIDYKYSDNIEDYLKSLTSPIASIVSRSLGGWKEGVELGADQAMYEHWLKTQDRSLFPFIQRAVKSHSDWIDGVAKPVLEIGGEVAIKAGVGGGLDFIFSDVHTWDEFKLQMTSALAGEVAEKAIIGVAALGVVAVTGGTAAPVVAAIGGGYTVIKGSMAIGEVGLRIAGLEEEADTLKGISDFISIDYHMDRIVGTIGDATGFIEIENTSLADELGSNQHSYKCVQPMPGPSPQLNTLSASLAN